MIAFQHAVEDCGTQMLELDVQLTRDHQVVVTHDPDLRRAGRRDVLVNDLALDQLPLLDAVLPLDFQPGRYFDASRYPERRIPLLSEVFRRFPDVPINIDVKLDDDRLVAEVVRLVAEFQRQHLTCWGNSSAVITDKLYAKDPSVPLLFPMAVVLKVLLAAYTGLLPFLPLRWSCFEVPMPAVMLPYATSRRGWLSVWMADKLLMRPFILNHLRRRGIQVYLWVLNNESEYRRAFQLGADGVMTDYPSELRAFLRRNPQLASLPPGDKPAASSAQCAKTAAATTTTLLQHQDEGAAVNGPPSL